MYISLLLAILLASCRSTPIQPVPTVATAPLPVSTATKIPQTRTAEIPTVATLPLPSSGSTEKPFTRDTATLSPTILPQVTPTISSHPNSLQPQDTSLPTSLPTPTNDAWGNFTFLEIRGTSFINREVGWARFNDTLLYQTRDGGATWKELPHLQRSFRNIQFASITRGWAIADDGLYTTQDGGQSWGRILKSNFAGWGPTMKFINETDGFLLFETGLHRTTDGGKTWQPLHPEAFAGLKDDFWGLSGISFINAMKGWVLFRACNMPACHMKLFMTEDGGESFTLISEAGLGIKTVTLNWLRPGDEIYFLDDLHGWFVGNQYFIQYTDDGGKTWKSQRLPSFLYSINDIHMFTDSEGIAAGWGNGINHRGVMKTNDGGVSWQQMLP